MESNNYQHLLSMDGIKHNEFNIIAALTEFISGIVLNVNMAKPITCNISNIKTYISNQKI